jgi:coproporphyrinogen III oxidase-like Fe-S oxidoreductase
MKEKSIKDTIKDLSCRHIKEVNQEIHVSFESISMDLMHNKYNRTLYSVDSSLIEID